MKEGIKLCYSFSARMDNLGFIDLLHSLHIAKQWFKKDDIVVFFTPPYSDEYQKIIEKYATVIRKSHYSIPHPIQDPNDPTPPQYWDKFYFTEIDAENVIFLDNDTELQYDIRKYFDKYDFDILVFGEDGRTNQEFIDIWQQTWDYLKIPLRPVLMTTVILFKNYTQTKLKKEINNAANMYMIDKLIKMPAEDRLFDEYIFSLATHNCDIKIMPKNKDMLWTTVVTEASRNNATILHGGARKLFSIGTTPTEEEIFSKDLLKLIKQFVPLKHWIERVAATFLTMLEDEYSNFDVYFSLEDSTIVMHINVMLSLEIMNQIYSYVWANQPKKYNFMIRSDL